MLPASYRNKESNYFCRFTFNQFFTLLVIEVFTLFFIFYLGARYGRELLGFESAPTTQIEKESFPELTTTDPKLVAVTQDPEIQEMAKDLLKSAPTPDLKERVIQMLKESATKHEPLPVRREPKRVELSPKKKSQPKQEKKAIPPQTIVPKKPAKTTRLPKADPKASPVIQTRPFNARYSIQVGSYTNVDEAHSMVQYWKAKGYPAYVISADILGKGRWYRVRLGGFQDHASAKAYLQEFEAKEERDGFVAANE